MEKILFAASEVYPFVKTGGLADVASSLPRALKSQRTDIRIILPGYRSALANAKNRKTVQQWQVSQIHERITLSEDLLPQSQVKVWFVEHPLYDRDGGPYADEQGRAWPDNGQRFNLFCRAVADIALQRAGIDWTPQIVHCNDWQTGLVPALLKWQQAGTATVFTIHNLAYQGLFDRSTFDKLALPEHWWDMDVMEFYDKFSFIKGGLVFADMLNTVSPTYAREICTAEFGCGLEHLLDHRRDRLRGILNGVDDTTWNPKHDPLIHQHYGIKTIKDKVINKSALQQKLGLPEQPETPVVANIGRMAHQKGLDLILDVLPEWMDKDVQFVFLGTGDKTIEKALAEFAQHHPHRVAVTIDYDETLAHQIEAGADMFLMPSRFEPCGLNQLYSLRYGTVPVVHGVGGLVDTVIDYAGAGADNTTKATGFVFRQATAAALQATLERAVASYADTKLWRTLMINGMKQDFSWNASAKQYLTLYETARQYASLDAAIGP